MAFCEPASPRRIWGSPKHFTIVDFRRRHPGAFPNDNHVDKYVLIEIQTSLLEISPALTLEYLNLPIAPVRSCDTPLLDSAPLSNTDDINSINPVQKSSTKSNRMFHLKIWGEILPGVTVDNPEAPVRCPFNHYYLRPRAYFLGAPGGREKIYQKRYKIGA